MLIVRLSCWVDGRLVSSCLTGAFISLTRAQSFSILFSGAEALNWAVIMRPEMQPGEQNVDPLPDELPVVDEMLQPSSSIKERRRLNIRRVAIGLLLVGFVVFVIIDSSTTGYIRSGINNLLDWIKEHPIQGWFVFSFVYFVATILFIPGLILTLGAGFVFGNAFHLGLGVVLGTMSVFLGASAGATVSFLLGRYLLRDWVIGLTQRYAIFAALDSALEEKGFRIMVLLRLSPIIPFNAINYIAGVTSLSLRDFVLSLWAIVPGTALYVFLGASADSLMESATPGASKAVSIAIVVCGVILGVGAIFLTSYYAKKELNRILAERQCVQDVGRDEAPATESARLDNRSDHESVVDNADVV